MRRVQFLATAGLEQEQRQEPGAGAGAGGQEQGAEMEAGGAGQILYRNMNFNLCSSLIV